jgi:Protein of unknown function (DUF3617)
MTRIVTSTYRYKRPPRRKKRGKQAVATPSKRPTGLPLFFMLLAIAAAAAYAEDTIKSGNWEYSATAQGVTQLPPGVQLSPEMRLGLEGLTIVTTRCITAADLFPPMHNMPEGCKIDKTDTNGRTLSWSMSCISPNNITSHLERIEHYHGETMDGQFTVRTAVLDHPQIESTQLIKGRYLGPCAN